MSRDALSDAGGVVAILFTDLVGSTEVLDRLGDDAAEELRRTHLSLLREMLSETDGTEVKTLGDGLMASFASPVKALSCAVGMQRTIAQHNRAHPNRMLQMRIGLHAGDPFRHDDDLHGTAVVVAKRLCDQANGGQILASALVAALVGARGDFRFRSAGHRKLKGLSQPTAAVTVEWRDAEPSSQSSVRPARGPGSGHDTAQAPSRPLVGRQPELGRIQQALADATSGRGRIVFVVGQMGIGKTRLVEEALGPARRGGVAVLVGRTPPAGSGLAYAPLLSAFGTALRSLRPVERDELIGDLPHLGRLWPEFGLPPPAPVQDADLERALLFEAVARLLDRLSSEAPVLLFVDDLHWADGPSLALLGYLVPTVAALPITVVGTYRPEGVLENKALRQFVTTARRSGLVSEVPLKGLDPDEVAALAAGILGDTPPDALLELSGRAAGTPLFVEAWIRGLLDAGALVRSGNGWTLVGDHPTALPRSVQELVVDRLDLLGTVERSTVELIAHGAQGLPHDLLQRAGNVDADELLAVIGRLAEAGLVVQDDDGPAVLYRLAHPLIQEVAAANLPAIASRRHHARLAGAVEKARPRDLDRLAFHYSRAGYEVDRVRALEVLLEAGERAHNLAAHDDAARHFGAALPLIRDGQRPELLAQVLERLGESWEPLGEGAVATELWTEALEELDRQGDVEGMARLHRRLAFASHASGDMPSASRHLAAGIEALRELPPSEQLADLHAARLYIELGLALGDLDWGHDAVDELTRLGEALDSPRVRAQARLSALQVTFVSGYAGPADRLLSLADEARRIAEDAGEWALARRVRRELGWVQTCVLGDAAALRENALAQLDLGRRLGDIAHQSTALQQLGYAALLAGDFDTSVGYGEEAVAQAGRYDQRRTLAISLGQLALARIHRGELDDARDLLTEAWQVIPLEAEPRAAVLVAWPDGMLALESGDPARVLDVLGPYRFSFSRHFIGTAQVARGDLEGAWATAELLAGMSPPGLYASGLAERVFGLIAHARGESDTALDHLERSIATLDTLRLPFEVAVSRLHAGTVEHVQQALVSFEALGAARYADKARRALRSLGVRQPSRRSARAAEEPLSRREMEVATLIAQGLANAEIAERLVVSVRTVESHLDHIYTRLGLSSRVALAQWVTNSQPAAAT